MSRAELKSYNRSKCREALLVGSCFALGALTVSASIILWADSVTLLFSVVISLSIVREDHLL